MTNKKIKDKNVLWLVDDIIDSFPGEINIPIENFTSQWFGNIYMNKIDRYTKDILHIKDYVRYCDDFLFFHNDKKILNEIAKKIEVFAKKN